MDIGADVILHPYGRIWTYPPTELIMYIDAMLDRDGNKIKVVERVDGLRVFKEYQVDHHFFVTDPRGKNTTIFGDSVLRLNPKTFGEKNKLVKSYTPSKLWESDINPIARCLEQNYLGKADPSLNIAFFDIETDYDLDTGYSTPEDANNKITSVSIYFKWLKKIICIAVPPPTLTFEQATIIGDNVGDCIIVQSEEEMLSLFLDLIEDADILSGWNSDKFDIIYLINRITKTIGREATSRLCLWDQIPEKKVIKEKTDKETEGFDVNYVEYYTYALRGRVHLDYMKLYKKYTFEQKQSYSLDNICRLEIKEGKIQYDGTLDQLYKYDFDKFLEYNKKDTYLINMLDDQLQYIDLASSIAHTNVVTLPQTMGTVSWTEQAIMCESHSKGLIIPNKKTNIGDTSAAGGWTPKPKTGLHHWIGSSDMNSLYPSTIRALNMSPETLVGQIRLINTKQAISDFRSQGKKYSLTMFWTGKFNVLEMDEVFGESDNTLFIDFEDGTSVEMSGADLREMVKANNWCISANGTIFSYVKIGIIPSMLGRWYTERKIMQEICNSYIKIGEGSTEKILVDFDFVENHKVDMYNSVDISQAFSEKKFKALLLEGDNDKTSMYINRHGLSVMDGYLHMRDDLLNSKLVGFWHKRQLVRKINLNSVYGGLLNEHHRFFDQRIGQSTTLTGRSITRHLAAKTNELITGKYQYDGDAVLYGDTDSTYFSAYETLKPQIDDGSIVWNADTAIRLYDEISSQVNATFTDFMLDKFNVPKEHGAVIRSSREMVALIGLFVKRKKYALIAIDIDGQRQDIEGSAGKLKVTGLELRRSDTPKLVQDFLSEILSDVLHLESEENIIQKINNFKASFDSLHPWEKGIPKSVNNLDYYKNVSESESSNKHSGKKTPIPGHVRASINWNKSRDMNNDNTALRVLNGSRIIVCYLNETYDNVLSNIAYPTDEPHLPDWFKNLPFDVEKMTEIVLDNKIKNIFGVLNWDLRNTNKTHILYNDLFGD